MAERIIHGPDGPLNDMQGSAVLGEVQRIRVHDQGFIETPDQRMIRIQTTLYERAGNGQPNSSVNKRRPCW